MSVSQSSTITYGGHHLVANRAIDGNMETKSHTKCAWNTDLWYKMDFDDVYCLSEVVIFQSHTESWNAYRMQDTKVFTVNSNTGVESLCGILKVREDWTLEGQTYRIPCNSCGDGIKLTLRHSRSDYDHDGCIHMKEIKALKRGQCIFNS